jgi:hypothetical protein
LIAAAPAPVDLSKIPPGKLPEDQFLALAGEFSVKDVDGKRVIELAATPLETFGLLFGAATPEPSAEVSARVWGDVTGKRTPEFGVGSNDAGGYKLWLMPRQHRLVIRKGDQTVASAKYDAWKPATWTRFVLQADMTGVRGKAWPDGSPEPKDWLVTFRDPEPSAPGRPSVWGNPYSGKPIRFDDLKVTSQEK